jgi:very-short-patch-repair endonuclease
MTTAENRIWLRLRGQQFYGLKFRRQHGIGSFIVDFFCPEKQVAVEIDGDVHTIPQQASRDVERESF